MTSTPGRNDTHVHKNYVWGHIRLVEDERRVRDGSETWAGLSDITINSEYRVLLELREDCPVDRIVVVVVGASDHSGRLRQLCSAWAVRP